MTDYSTFTEAQWREEYKSMGIPSAEIDAGMKRWRNKSPEQKRVDAQGYAAMKAAMNAYSRASPPPTQQPTTGKAGERRQPRNYGEPPSQHFESAQGAAAKAMKPTVGTNLLVGGLGLVAAAVTLGIVLK